VRPARAADTISPMQVGALVVDVQNCFIDGGTLPVRVVQRLCR